MEDTIDAVAVFRGATTLALKDGHLDDQEMRILARLSHALRLPEAVCCCPGVTAPVTAAVRSAEKLEPNIVSESIPRAMIQHT